MPTLYFNFNKRELFSAPQFTRQNHVYRGPRESAKVNLEINQLRFSFLKLYEKHENFRGVYQEAVETILNGNEISGVTDSSDEQFGIIGLNSIASRLIALETRIRLLER